MVETPSISVPQISKYAILKLAVPDDMPELRERYEIKANLHNADMMNTHYNSGLTFVFARPADYG
jgi:hypothetical protein